MFVTLSCRAWLWFAVWPRVQEGSSPLSVTEAMPLAGAAAGLVAPSRHVQSDPDGGITVRPTAVIAGEVRARAPVRPRAIRS